MSVPVFGKIEPGVTYVDRPGAYAFFKNQQNLYAIVRTPMGLFLPGGGLDPGEDPVAGLRREIEEEIGYRLVKAEFVTQAIQYHWSGFYQSHFKKIGYFYIAEAVPPSVPRLQHAHELLWLSHGEVKTQLTQEFQRWAAAQITSAAP